MTLTHHLDHLPDNKRRELALAGQIVFEEFENAHKGKEPRSVGVASARLLFLAAVRLSMATSLERYG